MMRWILLLGLLVLAAPAAELHPQGAAPPEVEAMTRDLASQMRCPVCQGVSIQDSPTELAVEMKGVIRDQLMDGRTPDEVKAYFVDRYGEWVLLQPEPRGFNLVVYILPLVGLLVGGGVVFATVRRWTRVPPSAANLLRADHDPADED